MYTRHHPFAKVYFQKCLYNISEVCTVMLATLSYTLKPKPGMPRRCCRDSFSDMRGLSRPGKRESLDLYVQGSKTAQHGVSTCTQSEQLMHTSSHILIPVGHSSVEVSCISREQPPRPTAQNVAAVVSMRLHDNGVVGAGRIAGNYAQPCSHTRTHLMLVRCLADRVFDEGDLFMVPTTYTPT